MSWDKIKVHLPFNQGNKTDGESEVVRPPDNPTSGEDPLEQLPNSMRGRRGRSGQSHHANRGDGRHADTHPRVHDILNEGKQKLQSFFGAAERLPGERPRAPRNEYIGPPDQANIQNEDGGRTEGLETRPLRTRHSDDGEHGPRRDSLPKDNGRQRNVEGDHSGDTRRTGRDAGPPHELRESVRDLRDTVRDLGSSRESHGPNRSRESHGDNRSRESHGHNRSSESYGDNRSRESYGSNRAHESHGDNHASRARGSSSDNRSAENSFHTQFQNSGRDRNVFDNTHGRNLLNTLGHSDERPQLGRSDDRPLRGRGVDVASLVSYLRGEASGSHLPAELRQVLDGASRVMGHDFLRSLESRAPSADGERVVRFVEHALERVARTLERGVERGGATTSSVPARAVQEAVGELLAATLLDKYFRQAEKTGGRVVAEAEVALARLLYGETRGGDGGVIRRGSEEGGRLFAPAGFESSPTQPRPELRPAPHPLEVLRDLHAGAFLPPEVNRNPFPLTGRALVATEMMEMMRTLDAVERLTRELLTAARAGAAATTTTPLIGAGEGDEAPALALLRALAGTAAGVELLDELFNALPPMLPGRAARQEIPRLVAALGGVLVDTAGHTFVAKDGTPLKLDQVLWLGSMGGSVSSIASGAESFPMRLSPLLIYGFDAVYSLIGFDGRTLNPPHFAAVQAQVNGSEMEWVFGQPPLSEGWMRALIERLKDSAQADHNLLGEMLEEALADGRFHAALVGGTVSEGEAVADTFAVTRLLPGATVDAAFSPA